MRRTSLVVIVVARRLLVVALLVLVSVVPVESLRGEPAERWATCGRFVTVETVEDPDAWLVRLHDVAHLGTDDAWAVGSWIDDAGTATPLVLRWDGWRWNRVLVTSSGPAMQHAGLEGVTARAQDDVWAVGSAGKHPLALHWDGLRWSRTPQPAGLEGVLLEVAAIPGTRSLWAVGYTGRGEQPLIERWTGTTWRRVKVPGFESWGSLHHVVAFPKIAFVSGMATRRGRPLLMRWNGTSWNRVRVPHADSVYLGGLDGTSPGRVWMAATLHPEARPHDGRGVVMRWEDGRLRIVHRLDRRGWLSPVTVTGPHDLWVAGALGEGDFDVDPFALHRGPRGWTVDPSPTAARDAGGIVALDGTPNDLWAVANDVGEHPRSYLLHRC